MYIRLWNDIKYLTERTSALCSSNNSKLCSASVAQVEACFLQNQRTGKYRCARERPPRIRASPLGSWKGCSAAKEGRCESRDNIKARPSISHKQWASHAVAGVMIPKFLLLFKGFQAVVLHKSHIQESRRPCILFEARHIRPYSRKQSRTPVKL